MFKLSKIFGSKKEGQGAVPNARQSGTKEGGALSDSAGLKPFEFNVNIDSALAKDSKYTLHGWTYCADTKVVKVEIKYKDVIKEATIGLKRADVMQSFEHCQYLDTGFHFQQEVDAKEEERKVTIIATGENGKVYDFEYEIPEAHWTPSLITEKTKAIPGVLQKEVSPKNTSNTYGGESKGKNKFILADPPRKNGKKFDYKFHVDVTSTASNMLILQGWSFICDTRIKRIEVIYDGLSKDATIGFDRSDVKTSFEQCDYADAGFYFQGYIDYKTKSKEVKILIHGEDDSVYEYVHPLPTIDWFPEVKQKNSNKIYGNYFKGHTYDFKRRNVLSRQIETFEFQPMITIIVPVYNVDVKWMELAVDSIINQVYTNWELLLVDDKSTSAELIDYLKTLDHPQIRVHWSEVNGNISKATNIGVSLAKGEYILFMDNDDKLDETALYEVAFALNKNRDAEILYSDEDKINTKEYRSAPVLKPDWSPELLLTTNYFNHILVVKKELCEKVKYRTEFDGCQDWDFILRLIEISDKVYHIPKVLYNWRTLEGSISRSGAAKENMSFYSKCEKAINLHLKRNNIPAVAKRPKFAVDQGVVLFDINSTETVVQGLSLVLYLESSKKKSDLINSLVKALGKGDNEILVYHDGSTSTLKKLFSSKNFNNYKFIPSEDRSLSEIYNDGADQAKYDDLLFIDDKIESVSKQLILNLQLFAKRDKMGVLGSKLRESENVIHSTGYILGLTNDIYNDLYPSKAFHKEENDHGYFFYKQIIKNYSAITKELFYVKKDLFKALDGFDSKSFADTLFDVDFCLRASKKGYRHVSLPGETMIHIEEEEAFNLADLKQFHDRYSNLTDPFYNENFSKFDQFDYRITDKSTSKFKDATNRILFCTHNLNFEGAPIHIFELIEQMKSSSVGSFDIEIYSPYDGPLAKKYEEIGVKVNLISNIINNNPNKFKSELQFEKNINKIAKWMSGKAYDFVFCNTILSFEFIIAADLACIPTIWNIHESTPISSFYRSEKINIDARLREAFDTVSEVVFSSKNTADLYKDYLNRNNYTIITNGIKEDEIIEFKSEYSTASVRKELNIKEDNIVYLSLGSFGPRKGQLDFVLAALETLKKHDTPEKLSFVMVGADKFPAKFSYTDNINYLIENSGFQDNFKVLPVVSNINKYYRASDVFVCTSYNESSPRVILIAMLFDLPIITTPVYGIKEQVIENENALYYAPGDVKKLHACMNDLYNDNKKRNKFTENSSTVLNLSNSHSQMIEAYVKVIEKVN